MITRMISMQTLNYCWFLTVLWTISDHCYVYIYITLCVCTLDGYMQSKNSEYGSPYLVVSHHFVYNEYRQFTLDPEGGAHSNATLFDNRQQKNRWIPCVVHLKTKPTSDHVLILNASLTDKGVYVKGLHTQLRKGALFSCILPLSFCTNPDIL